MISRRTFVTTGISSVILSGLVGCTESTEQPRNESNAGKSTHHDTRENTNDHKHNQEVSGPVDQAEVAMITNESGYHFDPHIVWVSKGGTVTWILESGSHTATSYHPTFDKPRRIPNAAAAWDSGMLTKKGATFERTFEDEGIYDYFCIPHEYRGMVGSVIVGHPKARDQPGLAPSQQSLPKEAQAAIKRLNAQVTQTLENTN